MIDRQYKRKYMSNEEIRINLKGISKEFDTDEITTTALRGVDLIIRSGDYVSISGPSGCGKSTLLSILGLLDMPTSGEYFIDGTRVSEISLDQAARIRNQKIGFVFQSFNLIDELSVFENVALPLRYSKDKVSEEDIHANVSAVLEKVGIGHRIKHYPNQLSGGQQQRVAIARALVSNPAILLVDEPTGNLDSKSGDKVFDILDLLNQEGVTICMVTHDPRYANRAKTHLQLFDGVISQLKEIVDLEAAV